MAQREVAGAQGALDEERGDEDPDGWLLLKSAGGEPMSRGQMPIDKADHGGLAADEGAHGVRPRSLSHVRTIVP
jgi:hypothetical protein